MSTVLGEVLGRVARGVAAGWRLGALQTSSSSVEVGAGLSTSGSFAALARRQHGEASGTGDPNSASSKLVDTIYDPGRRVERVPAAVLEDMVSLLTRARARDVTVIELKDNPLADHFVVATGRSLDHLKRIAGGCQHLLKKADLPSRIEGGEGSEWVLLDGGSVIVHVFSPRARAEYDLEGMHGEQDGSNVRSVPNPEEVESL